ncbi:MAG: response regulator [Desulfuromonadaceae bacterium]|nr:response regulator [Desulfuromonadaceae bacterium]
MSQAKHILIVDDEENSRMGLAQLLIREGYQVCCAADGQEALEVLRRQVVDIVLSDIRMPGINGIVLLNLIRMQYPDVQVVMITAHGEVNSYLDAMNLGAADFVHKPVKLSELKLVLQKMFCSSAQSLPV